MTASPVLLPLKMRFMWLILNISLKRLDDFELEKGVERAAISHTKNACVVFDPSIEF